MENNAIEQDLVQLRFCGADNSCAYEKSKIAILPVPYGKTVSYKAGTEKGPRAMLDASANLELFDDELGRDASKIGIYTADELRVQMLSPEEMATQVEAAVDIFLKDEKFTVVIGGEHTVTIGAVKAVAKKYQDLSVLSLDAHHDLRDSYKGSKMNHACVNRRLSEVCKTAIVGTRSLSREEKGFLPNQNVTVFSVYDILDTPNWREKIKNALSGNIYLSIDLDVFDPSIMPSVGTPEPGGLGWYEVLDLLNYIIKYKNIVACDIVELSPINELVAPDFMAAKLIYKFLGYINAANLKKALPKKEIE